MVKEYVAIDFEMSGVVPRKDKIIEIGAVKVINGIQVNTFSCLINPCITIDKKITNITGINNQMLEKCDTIEKVLPVFLSFIEGYTLVGHNIEVDYAFLKEEITEKENKKNTFFGIDTLLIARKYIEKTKSKKLIDLCESFGIEDQNHHRALNDAVVTSVLYQKLCELYETKENEADFMPHILNYKTKNNQPATKKQMGFLKRLISYHGLQNEYDFQSLSRSEASKLADKIILHYGKMEPRLKITKN